MGELSGSLANLILPNEITRSPNMDSLAEYWVNIQASLYPRLDAICFGSMTDKLKQLVAILDVVSIEKHVSAQSRQWFGRPSTDRRPIARAFVAKAVYNVPTTAGLIELLQSNLGLRQLCGFDTAKSVPSAATFSRSFALFAVSGLGDLVHRCLVEKYIGEKLVMHASSDSTAVDAREKAAVKVKPEPKPKKRIGRPRKGELRPPAEEKRTDRQLRQSAAEGLSELPRVCDKGAKTNSKGSVEYWIGWKSHVVWADGGVPLTAITTSASLNDSQAAIPLLKLTAERVITLYDVMDRGYDVEAIRQASRELGHASLIDYQKRGTILRTFDPAQIERYKVRTTAERGFSRLKDEFGLQNLRVRGHAKAHMHIMFGVLALFADQILRPFVC
jgi:transposase